jgi:hypothetical protein
MDIANIKKDKKHVKKNANVRVGVRITKDLSKWLKKKNYSPTGVFHEACKELGYKEKK